MELDLMERISLKKCKHVSNRISFEKINMWETKQNKKSMLSYHNLNHQIYTPIFLVV